MIRSGLIWLSLLAALAPATASAGTLCTVIADADTGARLLEEGTCDLRATPASTFKVALAVMGFDAGFLTDTHAPVLAYREGEVDWGGKNWRQPTEPTRWLKYSVVWYSQRITRALGQDTLRRYARAFGYGNADFSGDPGKNNGLERAWISSSLTISPLEQVAFLRKLVTGRLPVGQAAMDKTMRIVATTQTGDGWRVSGKTGGAYPRKADGSLDRARGFGWFVGWADRGERRLVFARLAQDETRQAGSPGIRARDAFLKTWPTMAATIAP
ncbi:class D beta-lactamase [Nitratireductor sp. CAU 1489]|uniref:beta-lactamase n=1 Tax=Nitratireductor arenosus TaxID=2682096 RepID=A0A844QIR8_9HYPH|nr:class D beta-lactamase [Nitratireductor arenosus]MVA99195.1 class D beta-lactamase [Nitratireductor arenosus]